MRVKDLEEKILGIDNLVNVGELRLYKVFIQLNNRKGVYTGLNENKNRNEVQIFANKAAREYNLLEMLLRLKRCGQDRNLVFLYNFTKYQVKNVYIDSINYEFTIRVY